VVEGRLGAQPGVLSVDANPVAQTATVAYDPAQTNVATLKRWVEECGYHCAGRSVPGHLCDPLAETEPLAPTHDHAALERAEDAGAVGGPYVDPLLTIRNR
jgi:P-type Cu2+ transporter